MYKRDDPSLGLEVVAAVDFSLHNTEGSNKCWLGFNSWELYILEGFSAEIFHRILCNNSFLCISSVD